MTRLEGLLHCLARSWCFVIGLRATSDGIAVIKTMTPLSPILTTVQMRAKVAGWQRWASWFPSLVFSRFAAKPMVHVSRKPWLSDRTFSRETQCGPLIPSYRYLSTSGLRETED